MDQHGMDDCNLGDIDNFEEVLFCVLYTNCDCYKLFAIFFSAEGKRSIIISFIAQPLYMKQFDMFFQVQTPNLIKLVIILIIVKEPFL